jgi:hypothetical protein
MMKRRILQIAVTSVTDDQGLFIPCVFALDDDGGVWEWNLEQEGWVDLPDLPDKVLPWYKDKTS